jgi:transcription initiation factor IIF auxiliary subunit
MSLETRQDTSYEGEDWWRWSVWLEGAQSELDSVQYVIYTLHPTFPNRIRKIEDRSTKFRLDSSGWGGFRIRILVEFKNGEKSRMAHELELFYPEPNIKATKGHIRTKAAQISRVFVSSSAADSPAASIIKRVLQKQKITPKDLTTVESQIPYHVSIEKAIRTSDALIAVRSDAPSSWVEREIAFAKNSGVPVIMVDTLHKEIRVEKPALTALSRKHSSAIDRLSVSLGKSLKSML